MKGHQVGNQGEVQSQINTDITIGSPVIHKFDSAGPNTQKFCAQDCDAPAHSKAPSVQHGQLCPETGQSSVLSATAGRGIHRTHDNGRPERRVDDVWESPHRQALRGDLGQPPGLGTMVCGPLLQQWQDGTSQDDQVHPPQDRRDREHRGTDTDANCQGKEPPKVTGSTSQDDASQYNSQDMASGVRDRLLRSDERDSLDRRRRSPRRDERPSGQNVEHGECYAEADRADVPEHHGGRPPDARRHPRNCNGRMGGSLEQLIEDYGRSDWALKAGEIDSFCHSMPNNHQAKFWEHVEMIEAELTQMSKIVKPNAKKLDLLEVFCSQNSSLTNQVNQLGGSAKRFGLDQGDLMKPEGRRELFSILIRHQPHNIWMSPTCGPWSKWSQFNCQRSLQSWDQINSDRADMLIQVALCLVLCRYQHRRQQHAHWEQPKGSLMMKLPQVQEISRYMIAAKPDLCNAGDLTDPQSMQPIKKGLEINTTSRKMYETLDPLKCDHKHNHQVIEGSTVSQGMSISRAKFSELYPRKFARLIAKTIVKHRFPLEKPMGSMLDNALLTIDTMIDEVLAAAVKERPAKRLRRAPSKGVKTQAATGALEQPGEAKRMKTNPQSEEASTSSPSSNNSSDIQQDLIEKALQQIEAVLPRVGKKQINSPNILQMLNAIFPKYQIVRVLAGKGTDRRFEPPSDINPEEAPYRRSIIRLRKDQQIILDPAWEKYDTLSKRQIIRQSPACRVNITMFAAVKAEDHQSPMPSSETVPEAESPDQPAADDGTSNPESLKLENSENQVNENPSEEDPNQGVPDIVRKPEPLEKDPRPPSAVSPAAETPSSTGLERHGPRFRALPKEEQAMIKRAHQNLCHPSPEQLSAVFRSKGCRPEICQAVFDLQCSTCATCQKPKIARPSTLKDALDFNDKVFIDGVTWTSKAGTMFHFYHLIDQATNYHVAVPAPSRSADQAINKVSESWFLWAGPPNTLIMDSATEFTSEMFGEFLQRHDVRGVVTSPHAHWQNGRCERHGQILQSMLNKIDIDSPITTYKDLQQALIQCTHAKNTLSIRAGFAPEVLVFGKNSKLPGSNISSDEISAHASANSEDAQGIAFRQNLALREKPG